MSCSTFFTNGQHRLFNRCLIELRQYDVGEYALRIIDLENKKAEILNFRLTNRNQYIFAPSVGQADEIRDVLLRTCLEEFLIEVPEGTTASSHQLQIPPHPAVILRELSTQEDQPFYRNIEPFECITCMDTIEQGDGILFHNCLHPFCKPCVLQMIQASTEPTIKCPHDGCTMILEERELRGVINDLKADQKVVDRLLDRGVTIVESRNQTVHCLTPDCTHWWFLEPEETNNILYCAGCRRWNCLACKAIHEGQTCQQYQEEVKLKETNDDNMKKDTEHLETMIKSGEAMYCPGCRAIIQKASGCDWIQCSQCKIEICFATKGPRWGPKGHGDTSGGCRCRVDNGKPCTPNCGNCH